MKKLAAEISWKDVARYFTHGLAFSTLFSVLAMAGLFISAILVDVGAVIGFVIGLVLLFLSIGFLDTLITEYLRFKVKYGFWGLLFPWRRFVRSVVRGNQHHRRSINLGFPRNRFDCDCFCHRCICRGSCGPEGG